MLVVPVSSLVVIALGSPVPVNVQSCWTGSGGAGQMLLSVHLLTAQTLRILLAVEQPLLFP